MGLHASPTCELNFGSHDGCIGYLCGEENKGLAHMFQMMNAARINTGVSGMTLASTAYQNALVIPKKRVQGRDMARRKPGSVPIIDHPDVRQDAFVDEGHGGRHALHDLYGGLLVGTGH